MVPLWKISGRLGNQLFQFAYIYSQMRDGKIPDLYVQDVHYFEKYEKELQQLLGDGITERPEIGIHVRRGDYVDNPFYVDLTKTDYYARALELFPEKNFVVVSDDIEFCKKYFGKFNREFTFIENGDEISDFNTLASCSSQIIANSSFSYWAAFLNTNEEKEVVYPSQWFSDGISRVGFPKEWLKL